MPPAVPGRPPHYAPAPPPKKTSAVPIVVIVIVVAFGGIFVLGIVAAIAIPALLRARVSANEAAAIGTMRTMASAQVAWAATHGSFGAPSCLGAPASCGEPAAPSVLMPEIAGLGPRSGYDFGFVLRPGVEDARTGGSAERAVAAADETPGISPPGTPSDAEVRAQLEQFSTPDTGATPAAPVTAPQTPQFGMPADTGGFAYWATPSNPGVTGNRRFCVDETGVVREYGLDDTWTAPSDDQPECPDTGRPIG